MQHKDKKFLTFNTAFGIIVKRLRLEKDNISISSLARQYDLDRGNLSKIERGLASCTFTTLWQISEALGIKCSELVRLLEDELGENFTLIDE